MEVPNMSKVPVHVYSVCNIRVQKHVVHVTKTACTVCVLLTLYTCWMNYVRWHTKLQQLRTQDHRCCTYKNDGNSGYVPVCFCRWFTHGLSPLVCKCDRRAPRTAPYRLAQAFRRIVAEMILAILLAIAAQICRAWFCKSYQKFWFAKNANRCQICLAFRQKCIAFYDANPVTCISITSYNPQITLRLGTTQNYQYF